MPSPKEEHQLGLHKDLETEHRPICQLCAAYLDWVASGSPQGETLIVRIEDIIHPEERH